MKTGIHVVYVNGDTFVTDFGAPVHFTSTDDLGGITLPRYGVWRPNSRGKAEVFHTTDDFNEALKMAGARINV